MWTQSERYEVEHELCLLDIQETYTLRQAGSCKRRRLQHELKTAGRLQSLAWDTWQRRRCAGKASAFEAVHLGVASNENMNYDRCGQTLADQVCGVSTSLHGEQTGLILIRKDREGLRSRCKWRKRSGASLTWCAERHRNAPGQAALLAPTRSQPRR